MEHPRVRLPTVPRQPTRISLARRCFFIECEDLSQPGGLLLSEYASRANMWRSTYIAQCSFSVPFLDRRMIAVLSWKVTHHETYVFDAGCQGSRLVSLAKLLEMRACTHSRKREPNMAMEQLIFSNRRHRQFTDDKYSDLWTQGPSGQIDIGKGRLDCGFLPSAPLLLLSGPCRINRKGRIAKC